MYANWVVNDPATVNVLRIVMSLLTVASTEADVPPKVSATAVPAPPPPLVTNMPLPMHVEFAPAAPIVRNTRRKDRNHGWLVVAPGVVTAMEAPSAAPAVPPYSGVIVRVPVAAKDMMPPASTA